MVVEYKTKHHDSYVKSVAVMTILYFCSVDAHECMIVFIRDNSLPCSKYSIKCSCRRKQKGISLKIMRQR